MDTSPKDFKDITTTPATAIQDDIKTSITPSNSETSTDESFREHNLSIRSLMREEPIKIVPGKYRRSLTKIINDEVDNKKLIDLCCPRRECVCHDNCTIPKCELDKVAIIVNASECCSTYECQPKRNCTELADDTVWMEPCSKCRCIGKQMFCEQLCKQEELEKTCKHDHSPKIYTNGETWMQDSCTTCECQNGTSHCTVSSCLTKSCPKQVHLKNECCPICDYSESHFCPGFENCDIACQFEFIKSPDGCLLCKCDMHSSNATSIQTTTDNSLSKDQRNYNLYPIILLSVVFLIAICSLFICWKKCRNTKTYKPVQTKVDGNWNKI